MKRLNLIIAVLTFTFSGSVVITIAWVKKKTTKVGLLTCSDLHTDKCTLRALHIWEGNRERSGPCHGTYIVG